MRVLALFLLALCTLYAEEVPFADAGVYYSRAERIVLSGEITLYFRGSAVLNHPGPGFEARRIQVKNNFAATPGCYVACRSAGTLLGLVRISGIYDKQTCRSEAKETKNPCAAFPGCSGKCSADTVTGSLFGIAPDGSVNTADCARDVQIQMNGR